MSDCISIFVSVPSSRGRGGVHTRQRAASPWAQILWENCCYLADDERRARAFALLEKATRLDPERILAASDAALREVTGHGIVTTPSGDTFGGQCGDGGHGRWRGAVSGSARSALSSSASSSD